MKSIVINEWLLEFGKPNTQKEEKELAKEFFEIIKINNYQYVVIVDNVFHKKLQNYEKEYSASYHMVSKNYSKLYYKALIKEIETDSNKCLKYYSKQISIKLDTETEELLRSKVEETKNNFESDRYLFEAAYLSSEKVIVTTDDKLIKRFANNSTYKVQHIKEFIKEHKNTK